MSGGSKYSSFTPAGSPCWIAGQVPNWRGGTFDGWRHAKAVYAVDFADERAMCDARETLADACLTIERASPHYLKGDDGAYQTFDVNRLVTAAGRGAFIGGATTNKIRNPRGEGGAIGTVGVTNKCRGYNAAPLALVTPTDKATFNAAVSGIVASLGDVGSLAGIVDDLAALQAVAATYSEVQAGLKNGWLSGRVCKIDNTAGAVTFDAVLSGPSDGTNASISLLLRGSGAYRLTFQSYGNQTPDQVAPAVYTRVKLQNQGAGAGDQAKIRVAPGAVVYFILWQLEQGATAAPAPTVVAGASATGALPMNWQNIKGGPALSLVFLGNGMEYGLPSSRLRWVGTAATSGSAKLIFDADAYAVASAGQAWGCDFGVELVAGSLALTPQACLDFAGTSGVGAVMTLSATKQLMSVKQVLSEGTFGVVGGFSFYPVSGNAYDFTIDIFSPKLVRLAVIDGAIGYMPLYPILPPINTLGDSTRYADIVRAVTDGPQPFSRWEDAGLEEGAGVFVVVDLSHGGDGAIRPLFEINDGSADNYVCVFIDEDDRLTLEIVTGNVVQTSIALAASVGIGRLSLVCAWTADGGYICDNTGQVARFAAVTLPVGLAYMQIGGRFDATYFNDTLRQIQACLPVTQSEAAVWLQGVSLYKFMNQCDYAVSG